MNTLDNKKPEMQDSKMLTQVILLSAVAVVFGLLGWTSLQKTNSESGSKHIEYEQHPLALSVLNNDMQVYTLVEQMPRYRNSNTELHQLIRKHISFECNRQNVEVVFVVTKDGRIVNAKVVGSINPEFDKSAINIVKSLDWQPGIHRGERVNVKYRLPLTICAG